MDIVRLSGHRWKDERKKSDAGMWNPFAKCCYLKATANPVVNLSNWPKMFCLGRASGRSFITTPLELILNFEVLCMYLQGVYKEYKSSIACKKSSLTQQWQYICLRRWQSWQDVGERTSPQIGTTNK